jgi:internalin A
LSSASCEDSPCQNGGTCHPTLGQRYLCTCPEAFGGVHCEIDCSGEIDFPDAAFEAAVRSSVFIDDGELLTAETLADVTSLTVSDTTVSDLTGIECMPRLSWLSLYEVGLVDLSPLAALPRLTSLNATCNSITDLSPLQNLVNLTTLDIGKASNCIDLPGQVSDLTPLADLLGLATLGLAGQDADSLAALSKLTHLDFLVLANNERLESLAGLESADYLQYVVLTDTLVNDISSLAGHPTLQTLYLSGSPVSDLTPLVTADALERLYVVATELDCTEQAENLATLQSRGVEISSDCD